MIWNHEAETQAPERRRALQLDRLRDRVRWAAARVPLYRDRLAAAGVSADSLRGLEDLPRLPFLRKADLREHYPFGRFAVPRPEVVRLHASSGRGTAKRPKG